MAHWDAPQEKGDDVSQSLAVGHTAIRGPVGPITEVFMHYIGIGNDCIAYGHWNLG